MSRYVYQPMEYKEYLKNFVDTLKTGELLVDMDEHDVYVTEEGINIPIPVTKTMKNDIINYLETDLEGIKLQMKITPEKIDNIFKIKSEIEEKQQTIYGHTMDLSEDVRDIINRSFYISKINEYNVNQLGDLNFDFDECFNIDSTIQELQNLISLFNYYNEDCRSIYSEDFTNKNNELIRIWNEIKKLFYSVNNKLNRLGNGNGTIQIQRKTTISGNIYDVEWHRRLWNYTNNVWGKTATSEAEYISLIKQTMFGKNNPNPSGLTSSIKSTNCFTGFMANVNLGDNYLPTDYPNRGGSNIYYPGFVRKIDLNFEANSSESGKSYYKYRGRRYPAWDCFELPPIEGSSTFTNSGGKFSGSGVNILPTTIPISYIRSAPNRVIPFFSGSTQSTFDGFNDLMYNNPVEGFSTQFNGAATINQNVRYGGGTATWRQDTKDLFNKTYKFNRSIIESNSRHPTTSELNSGKYIKGQLIPKYGKGLDGNGNDTTMYSGNFYSPVFPSVTFLGSVYFKNTAYRGYPFSDWISDASNVEGISWRLGVTKKFNSTSLSNVINLNYNNDKGWIK